eukprot:5214376-Amphidinium_carterae.1
MGHLAASRGWHRTITGCRGRSRPVCRSNNTSTVAEPILNMPYAERLPYEMEYGLHIRHLGSMQSAT